MEKPGKYGNNGNFKPSASRFFFKRDTQSTAIFINKNTLQSILIYILYNILYVTRILLISSYGGIGSLASFFVSSGCLYGF